MDTKIDTLATSTAKMEEYILQLIATEKESRKEEKEHIRELIIAEKEHTNKLISTERRNTNIFVGIIVTIVVIAVIKYLLS